MVDNKYIKAKMNEEIKCAEEFDLKFKLMCHALGVLTTNDDGKFKTMNELFSDIAIAYYKYCFENVKFNFSE